MQNSKSVLLKPHRVVRLVASIEVGAPKSAVALCEEAMRRQRKVIAEMRPPRPEDIATRNSLETAARRACTAWIPV